MLPGVLNGLMQTRLQQFERRQFGEVFTDADRFGIEFEQLHLPGVGRGAQDQADRRFLSRCALMFVEPAQVKLHLPGARCGTSRRRNHGPAGL